MKPNEYEAKLEIRLGMFERGKPIKGRYQIYKGMLEGVPYFMCVDLKTGADVEVNVERGSMISIMNEKPRFDSDYEPLAPKPKGGVIGDKVSKSNK